MKNYTPVLLLLLLPLLAVGLYASFADTWDMTLEKISLSDLSPWQGKEAADTLADVKAVAADSAVVDTTGQRILFFGDSMVEGLGPRLAEYCAANGHDLTYVCWYSSTSIAWDSDTLRHYLNEVRPTYVIVTMGGNEQQTRDIEGREKHIRSIVSTIGATPYIWICTPAWDEVAPFNDIPKGVVGDKRFFDSRKLNIERAPDHKHPSFAAARKWMDKIAQWMQSPQTAHPIKMDVPPEGTSNRCHAIYLKPQKGGTINHVEYRNGVKAIDSKAPAKAAATPAAQTRPVQTNPAAAPAAETPAAAPAATTTPASAAPTTLGNNL